MTEDERNEFRRMQALEAIDMMGGELKFWKTRHRKLLMALFDHPNYLLYKNRLIKKAGDAFICPCGSKIAIARKDIILRYELPYPLFVDFLPGGRCYAVATIRPDFSTDFSYQNDVTPPLFRTHAPACPKCGNVLWWNQFMNDESNWFTWFAWRPVYDTAGKQRWLEIVQRRARGVQKEVRPGLWHHFTALEYRKPVSE